MKKINIWVLFIIIALTPLRLWAQETIVMDKTDIFWGNIDISKSKKLDNSQLLVSYEFQFVTDTIQRRSFSDLMLLQVGEKFTKFFSYWTLSEDQSYSKIEDELLDSQIRHGQEPGIASDFDIWHDFKKQILKNIHRMPYIDDKVMVYEEAIPNFKWEILEEQDSICGYRCFAAKTNYGGRSWTVWFTSDIPVKSGPWKFSGLPGLILKAEDSQGYFMFNAVEIVQNSAPLLWYTRCQYRKVSKNLWQKFDRNSHVSPISALGPGYDFFLFDSQTNKATKLNDSWSHPYNPIESYLQ